MHEIRKFQVIFNLRNTLSMKKILILILFFLFGWAGSTWFIGNETESLLKSYLDNSKKAYAEMGMKANFEIKDYKKSFLKSTAKTVISFSTGDPELDELFKNIQFNNTITHGPLLWANGKLAFGTAHIHSTLDMEALEAETREILKRIFADKNPLNSHLTFGIDETVDYELVIPEIAIKETMSQLMIKDGISLSGTMDKNTLMGTVKGTVGAIEIKDDGLLVKTALSTLDIDMQGMIAGQMLGTAHFSTPSIKIEGKAIPPLSFGIELSSDAKKEGDEGLNSAIQLIASNIKAPIDVSTIKFDLTFKELQIKGLEQLAAIQKDLEQLQSNAFNTDMSEEEQDAAMNKLQNLPNIMLSAIQNIFKQDKTAINLKLDIASQQGNALLDINTRYTGNGANFTLEELSTNTLATLLKVIEGKIDFSSPKAMLANTPAMFLMPSLIKEGVIAEDSDSYRLNVLFNKNAITLNNKPISVEEFAQLLNPLGVGASQNEPADAEELDQSELPPALLEEELSKQSTEKTVEETEQPIEQEKTE